MTNSMNFWQVDAFTKIPFKGNPAAVFILREALDNALMQDIAVEMNLSETAFVLIRDGQNPLLRWFTPMSEIDLCGHATLASAHIYLTTLAPEADAVTFDTKFVGPLRVVKNGDAYTMDFPARAGEKIEIGDIPPFVLDALTPDRPVEAYKARDLMLVYENERTIREMNPDFNALMGYKDFIIVTAQSSDPRHDFISRFFCADDGIAEDPVTGSAHCTSTPYWSQKLGKTKLNAYQASRRSGDLALEIKADRVLITGNAVTVIEGTMKV